MAYPIGKRIIPPIVKLWIKEVNGMENVPRKGPFIIAANHESYMDHLIIVSIFVLNLKKKINLLAKKEHFDNIIKSIWHKWAGAIPIDRQARGYTYGFGRSDP